MTTDNRRAFLVRTGWTIAALLLPKALFASNNSSMLQGVRKWFSSLAGAKPEDLTFINSVPTGNGFSFANVENPIKSDDCYIELYIESLRLSKARIFASKFHGIVYTYLTLCREGGQKSIIASVSKPAELSELNDNNVDRVIKLSKKLMGPIAFRGGPVGVELGLFSVRAGDQISLFVDYVAEVSDMAGTSYVGKAKPFLPLIVSGMDIISGQTKHTALEVGLDTSLNLSKGTTMAIINKPSGTLDTKELSIGKDHKLLLNRKPLDAGYAVFSIRSVKEKYDYGEIPELRTRYDEFRNAIRNGNRKESIDAFKAFRREALISPDLIPPDAKRLVRKVERKLEAVFPPGGHGSIGQNTDIGELKDIGLYGNEV